MRDMPRLVSLAVLATLILLLGSTFIRVVGPFFLPLFLAAMTAIVCRPIYNYFLRRFKNYGPLAAGVTTATVLSIGLVPLLIGGMIASLQLYSVAAELDRESVKPMLQNVVDWGVQHVNRYRAPDAQFETAQVTTEISNWLRTWLTGIGDKSLGNVAGTTIGYLSGAAGAVFRAIICLLMYSIALFYFFADGPKLIQAGEALIPVNFNYQRQLLEEFSKAVRSVVVATFLAALAQGTATTLAIGVLGFHHLIGLFALASFAALIPLLGTWLVWAPCAIWLYTHGHPIQATGLVLYCIIFVGLIDNVVRTYVLNSSTKLHPLLAFVSVLGGIEVMGLWGVFIGPIIACCLHALVKIFNLELTQIAKERPLEEGTREPAYSQGQKVVQAALVSPGEAAQPALAAESTAAADLAEA